MDLSTRDAAVVRLVGQFGQLDTGQVAAIQFYGLDGMVVTRCLDRLLKDDYLRRTGRWAEANRAGSHPYVYRLGKTGWHFCMKEGRFRTEVEVAKHSIKRGDIFVDLLTAERAGRLKMLWRSTEHHVYEEVRADLTVDLGIVGTGRGRRVFIEVDRSTESPARIEQKLRAYWNAYRASERFGHVIFAVKDDIRAKQIRRKIDRVPERQELFKVCLFGEVVDTCLSL